ncbi:MAG TPA: DNA gyrase inhibitor YacG [Gammaproteobacteria bacterium]|nr:DNA gyrase inhibitor YacG [Gammaproteobacteria bacterium]
MKSICASPRSPVNRTETKTVNCPGCKKPVPWVEASQYRPFCSERCKLIDFGEWATGKNRLAGEPLFSDSEEEPLQ